MTKQKPGRIENPVLEQSKRRRQIDARRKHDQVNKTSITLKRLGIIATLIALAFAVANHYGWL